jgi:hypothetical protein
LFFLTAWRRTNELFGPERGQKPLQYLVIWRFSYAIPRDSQPDLIRNCALTMSRRFVSKTGSENLCRGGRIGAINLLNYAPWRQLIAPQTRKFR